MTDERGEGETSETSGGGGNPAEQVIARFGGLRPMASKIGLAVSTVQGWKNRGHIPLSRHDEIRAAARKYEIELDETELSRASGEAQDPAVSTAPAPEEEAATTATEAPRTTEDVWRNREPASTESAGNTASAAKSESMPETSSQRGGSFVPAMLVGALLLVVGVGAAVLAREAWLPLVDHEAAGTAQQTAERLTAIDDRLERMEGNAGGLSPDDLKPLQSQMEGLDERLAELASQVEQVSRNAGQEQDSLDNLGEVVSQLSARIDDISGNLPGGEVWQNQMAKLEEQLSQLSEAATQIRTRAESRTAAAFAMGQLREAVLQSRSYSDELATLRRLEGDDSAIAEPLQKLEVSATEGVPSLAALKRSFPATAREIVQRDRESRAEGWAEQIWNRASALVTVRPVGERSGDDTEAIVARAERRLEEDKLSATVQELEKLQGPAAEAASDWLARAKNRLQAEQALQDLGQSVYDASGAAQSPEEDDS